MTIRIATNSQYSAVLDNILAAQARQAEAGAQVSSQKKATDLKGYSSDSETLSALQSVQSKVKSFLDQSTMLNNKLSTQDLALNQLADSADGASQAIKDALASGRGDTLMQALQGFFQNSVEALNTKYNGRYLFAGAQVNTQPVQITSMSQLTTPVSALFKNDQYVTTNQVDETTTINSGFLADKLGSGLFSAFQAIQAFNSGPSGPFTGNLTQAQITFLQGQISGFDTEHDSLTTDAGQNGLMQKQVENVTNDLTNRQTMLQQLVGNITDIDVAKAASDLQMAQLSVQAAAQVFSTLKSSSLLNLLS